MEGVTMYRIIVSILVCVSLLGCYVPAKTGAFDQELKSDIRTCSSGLFSEWRASTQKISNNDTLIILCEYSTSYVQDKVWSCIWDPKKEVYACRFKQSVVQVSKEHIPTDPSDRYDLFCGPCAEGWKR